MPRRRRPANRRSLPVRILVWILQALFVFVLLSFLW
ncbi:MAG: hypothetical protein JWP15_2099, partial [Alphaproteobacteria bacterium]|nr:hypothetical protein [Alphaproteobacteria bacterium]